MLEGAWPHYDFANSTNDFVDLRVSMLEGAWPHYDPTISIINDGITTPVSMLEGAWPHYDYIISNHPPTIDRLFPCSKGRGPITTCR